MMKKLFAMLFCVLISVCATAELKYIEIVQTQNLPLFMVKSIDDFEAIISRYGASMVFLQYQPQSSSSTAFVIAENTYFSFDLEGYASIADFRSGKNQKYKNAQDYEEGKSLGFSNSEAYYFYTKNSFKSVKDCLTAISHKFPDSRSFYNAKNQGYSEYSDYKEFCDFSALGYLSKEEYTEAKSKGFYHANEFRTATTAGFLNKNEYSQAISMGLKTKEDFSAIEKYCSEFNVEKKVSAIYYFVQKIPKGEMSISVLGKSLRENLQKTSQELQTAMSLYISGFENVQEYERNRRQTVKRFVNIQYLFDDSSLKRFFNAVDTSKLGAYSDKTEIFKRK
jgi:hypothetical protein